MNDVSKKVFLLAHCRGLTSQTLLKLYKVDPTLKIVDELNDSDYKYYFKMSQDRIDTFRYDFREVNVEKLEQNYKTNNIFFLSISDPTYPYLLKEIADPPLYLFCKGNRELLNRDNQLISVVGTRNPSTYGLKVTEHILKPLIQKNWVIVSGLAKGIDACAHRTALNNNGYTIAVIGGGFNHLYPKENKTLALMMMPSNLILSEYPPNSLPQKWHFPMRNRIISGLSQGTIVVEAKERSGSLITAQLALEQNRGVFSVPGSIFESNSTGTNGLIQQGAKLITCSSHITEELYSV
ncbi:DNA-processing protein DprA [Metabacillus herbersteinensis]|uniref:DNA-processing protein DprA n=1 Tax=Metabacillus herbersteinensis TaxID=283816 RepID=A0ABV6GCX9_9BACI